MITEKDFEKALEDSEKYNVFARMECMEIENAATACFELAKKMAVGFSVFILNKGYIPTDQSFSHWKRQENQIIWSAPITTEQILELYLNSTK